MPKLKVSKTPLPPPMLRFVAAVRDAAGYPHLVRATPHDYPPTSGQITAFLQRLGWTTTEWTLNERETLWERFNHLWVGSERAAADEAVERMAWHDALAATCHFDAENAP